MEFGINPLGARVVVQPVQPEEAMSKGGVILVQQREPTTAKAEVIAIGDEVEKVAVGDMILLTLGAGDGVDFEQEMYVIVDELDILAVLVRN